MELSSKSYNSSTIYSIFVKFGEPLDKLITKQTVLGNFKIPDTFTVMAILVKSLQYFSF